MRSGIGNGIGVGSAFGELERKCDLIGITFGVGNGYRTGIIRLRTVCVLHDIPQNRAGKIHLILVDDDGPLDGTILLQLTGLIQGVEGVIHFRKIADRNVLIVGRVYNRLVVCNRMTLNRSRQICGICDGVGISCRHLWEG